MGMYLKQNNNSQGYTLIEIVIVLMITALVFVAIYSLFSKSIRYNAEGRYEIIAAELAQEGVEIIKNKREQNELEWSLWNGPSDGNPVKSFQNIEALNNCNPQLSLISGVFSCGASNRMQYNKTIGIEEYKTNCAGDNCIGVVFERSCQTQKIDITSNGEKNSLRVACTVSWNSLLLNNKKRSVNVEMILTDWQR